MTDTRGATHVTGGVTSSLGTSTHADGGAL
jgi:hypothetical protein